MLVLVLVSVLQLVGVLWLGLVVGLGVLRMVVGVEMLVVVFVVVLVMLVVLLVVLGVRVFGFDGVDSAWDWLGWPCYGLLAEGLVVGECQLGGGLVGVIGVLGDFNGLDGGVRVGVGVVVSVRHGGEEVI